MVSLIRFLNFILVDQIIRLCQRLSHKAIQYGSRYSITSGTVLQGVVAEISRETS